ncbi:GGDEF domain-containing response regulator [Salinispira pacifica]|uniref:diguanylate cyclase n=1 Tax=Salinispira pacifica TaxID=1307761 RepID=V5WKD3_9SPIO|nr:response regulator [Salinispira pacifica]AHC16213.1 hypothetical protein L21SP2_2865 [Salinispira pacifica]
MKSVLHVEPSDFFSKIVQEIIRERGMEYLRVSGVGELLRQLKSFSPDLIISAAALSDGSVEDMVQALNSAGFTDIPVLIVSSSESLEFRRRLFDLGVVDFLLKQDISSQRLGTYLDNLGNANELIRNLSELEIAVLDDSSTSLALVENIFRMNGIFNADYYRVPEHLLDSGKKYDLFIVDLVLPGMTGEEVILHLRTSHPGSSIIALSSISNTKTVSQVLLSGADDYIIKPFDASIFLARLRTNIRAYTLSRKLAESHMQLQQLADYDGLTGVYSHRKIMSILENSCKTMDNPEQAAVIMFDLDDFKQINDQHGHLAGDSALKVFAENLQKVLGDDGYVGRYGGEEFIAFLPNIPRDRLKHLVQTVVEGTGKLSLDDSHLMGGRVQLSVSAGICYGDGKDVEETLRKADRKLYQAKEQGKNRYIL